MYSNFDPFEGFSGIPRIPHPTLVHSTRELYPGVTISFSVSQKNLSFSSAVISMWSFSRHFE